MPEHVDSATPSADGDTKRVIRVPYVSDSDSRSESSQDDASPPPDVKGPGEVATPEGESEAHESADGGDGPPASAAEVVSPVVEGGSDGDDGQTPPLSEEEGRDAAQLETADDEYGPRPWVSDTSQPSKRWWQFWRK